MASWAPELPDPNAGDDLAYTEAWENRIRDNGATWRCDDCVDEPQACGPCEAMSE